MDNCHGLIYVCLISHRMDAQWTGLPRPLLMTLRLFPIFDSHKQCQEKHLFPHGHEWVCKCLSDPLPQAELLHVRMYALPTFIGIAKLPSEDGMAQIPFSHYKSNLLVEFLSVI